MLSMFCRLTTADCRLPATGCRLLTTSVMFVVSLVYCAWVFPAMLVSCWENIATIPHVMYSLCGCNMNPWQAGYVCRRCLRHGKAWQGSACCYCINAVDVCQKWPDVERVCSLICVCECVSIHALPTKLNFFLPHYPSLCPLSITLL